MAPQSRQSAHFNKRLAEFFQSELLDTTTLKVAKHDYIYVAGDRADSLYFVESGQVKLLMLSTDGKECLVSIHTSGDTFGLSCLASSAARRESAVAMEQSVLKRISSRSFLLHLTQQSLLADFTQYLVNRIAEQQEMIATLLLANSEHRLGETLLLLARKLGRPDPQSTRIEQKITHEELSEMVGTTRPRITHFLNKFRGMGLIQITGEHFFIIHEERLSAYLAFLN